MQNAEAIVRALRDAGIIPDATAAALLPAPRRKAAPCRNHRGSALRPEGACTAPAYRVYAYEEFQHNLCEKCLLFEAELFDHNYRVTEITEQDMR